MKAEPLPPGKHCALKRITAENKERKRRAFWRDFWLDMRDFSIIATVGTIVAFCAITALCAIMEVL